MKKLIVLLWVLSMVFLLACGSESGSEPGDQAYNFEVEDFEGNSVSLSDFEGKTVFVLAWTTTWGACIQELSEIHAVRDTIKEDAVIVIANLSAHDDIEKAKEIIKDQGLSEVSYFDVNDDINGNFDLIGVPAAIYIDPEGKIKEISFGTDDANGILIKIFK